MIGYWTELAPASLVATRANVTAMTFPWVWNPVLLSVLHGADVGVCSHASRWFAAISAAAACR